jgi:hypothetical protein
MVCDNSCFDLVALCVMKTSYFLICDSERIVNPAATIKPISFEAGITFIQLKARGLAIDMCPAVTRRYFFAQDSDGNFL